MKTPNENWVHGLGIGILVLVNIAGNPIPEGTDLASGVAGWLALVLLIVVQWMGIVWCVRLSWRRLPLPDQVKQRLIFSFFTSILWATGWMVVGDYSSLTLIEQAPYEFTAGKLTFYFFNAVILCFTAIGATEAVYYYTRLRKSEQEKTELQRIALATQYDSLKQQVNPHFLFNSLNSLSSLITIDPPRAEKFVEEMSQVYRYLLQSNRDELTTLRRELEFIKSYLHLLKTRFEGFRVDIELPEPAMQGLIPPLTLQLLMENAVKHNEVSAAHPLHLRFYAMDGDRLAVTNNLQRRNISVPSEKVGLANIIARYRLLNHPYVEVRETDTEFTVILPLIKN